jgi:hypothetical protein
MQFNKMNTLPGNDFLTKTNPSSSTIQDEFWDDVSPPYVRNVLMIFSLKYI